MATGVLILSGLFQYNGCKFKTSFRCLYFYIDIYLLALHEICTLHKTLDESHKTHYISNYISMLSLILYLSLIRRQEVCALVSVPVPGKLLDLYNANLLSQK